jgi:hypothetical protein
MYVYKAEAVGKRDDERNGELKKQTAEMKYLQGTVGYTRTFSHRAAEMELAKYTRLLLERPIVTGLVMKFLAPYGT